MKNHKDVVKLLLTAGANPDAARQVRGIGLVDGVLFKEMAVDD